MGELDQLGNSSRAHQAYSFVTGVMGYGPSVDSPAGVYSPYNKVPPSSFGPNELYLVLLDSFQIAFNRPNLKHLASIYVMCHLVAGTEGVGNIQLHTRPTSVS